MGKFGDKIAGIKQGIVTDANFSRAGRGIVRGAKALPSASGRYLLQKVPIVQWIPKYAPQWIVNDFIAGVTVGIVLIPQALVFSLVTGASPSVGLVSTLVPPVIYVFMGTSKDISTGPTGTSAFATSSIVALLAENKVPAFLTVPTATFTTGILSLIFGTLKLGFLLDFLSIPVLNGFMMGQALVALFQQIPLILGEQGVSPSFAQGSMQVATKILTSQPLTIAIGLPAVAFLLLLQFLGKKFGPRFALVRVIAHVRSLVVLVAFTAISFFVNKDLEKPVWAIIGDVPKLTITPSAPFAPLIGPLIALSIPVFLSAALEHLALARAFGRINGYEIDASQELVYLGVANMVNGVMGGMPVGGNIQRSAVNNASGVKTPLAGLFTSMFLLLALTQLTTVLAFMPTATLAAVLFVAILEVNPPQDIIGKYWKMSFAEFIATIISFNFALVATSEIGVAAAVVYSIFYALFRIMFSHPKPVTKADLENTYGKDPSPLSQPNHIPSGTQIMTLSQHLMFLNAYRMKRSIMNQVQTHFSGVPNERKNSNRVWNDFREKEILRMRRKAEVMTPTRFIPHLDCLILDFTHTTYIDVSGITMLQELRSELHAWAGDGFELRFVGLCPDVMTRFKRSMWQLVDRDTAIQGVTKDTDIYFELLKPAIEAMPRRIKEDEELDFGLSKPLTHNSMVGSYDEYEKYDMQDGQQPVISTSVYTRDGRAYNRNSE